MSLWHLLSRKQSDCFQGCSAAALGRQQPSRPHRSRGGKPKSAASIRAWLPAGSARTSGSDGGTHDRFSTCRSTHNRFSTTHDPYGCSRTTNLRAPSCSKEASATKARTTKAQPSADPACSRRSLNCYRALDLLGQHLQHPWRNRSGRGHCSTGSRQRLRCNQVKEVLHDYLELLGRAFGFVLRGWPLGRGDTRLVPRELGKPGANPLRSSRDSRGRSLQLLHGQAFFNLRLLGPRGTSGCNLGPRVLGNLPGEHPRLVFTRAQSRRHRHARSEHRRFCHGSGWSSDPHLTTRAFG